jgi:hypothetical protein
MEPGLRAQQVWTLDRVTPHLPLTRCKSEYEHRRCSEALGKPLAAGRAKSTGQVPQ